MASRLKPVICSLIAGLAVAAWSILTQDGPDAIYRLCYYTPAAMAAGALLADRFQDTENWSTPRKLIDTAVTILCLSRPVWGWPPASGHAVFFLHALLSGRSRATRVLAILLGAITLYAKIWLWHRDPTLWPGLLIGSISGLLWNRARFSKLSPGLS